MDADKKSNRLKKLALKNTHVCADKALDSFWVTDGMCQVWHLGEDLAVILP